MFYYKKLMQKKYLRNNNAKREDKWHEELNKRFSVITWDKMRYFCASIDLENPVKWLQYQILRNSLQTNVIVSHFVPNVSPECQFCHLEPEKISHIFWTCHFVRLFLNNIITWVRSTGLEFDPSREQFLFGYLNQKFDTPNNYLILHIKKYIWTTKFKDVNSLSVVGFKNYFNLIIRDLKRVYNEINKSAEFHVWNVLVDDLPDDHLALPLHDGVH